MAPKSDLPQGTLDMLILRVVALEPIHGYAIAQRIRQISRDVVRASLVVIVVIVTASSWPAARAGRIDPLQMLRHE